MDMIRHLSAHSSIPIFARVVFDSDGAAWFREYGASADRNVYWSCPSDRPEGLSLHLRADERLLAIGVGTVVSVRTDPYDVETVVIANGGGRR